MPIALPPVFMTPVAQQLTLALYYASRDVAPGEPAQLLGHFPADVRVCIQRFGTSTVAELATLNTSYGQIQFELPADYPFAAYRVWVKQGLRKSNALVFNQAVLFGTDSDCYMAGQTPHLAGVCLLAPNKAPRVRFVNRLTKRSITVLVDMANVVCDKYEVVLKPLPAMPVGLYDLYASNGYGAEAKLDGVIEIMPTAPDPYKLGVGWAGGVKAVNSRTIVDTGDATQNLANWIAAMQQLAAYPLGQRGPILVKGSPFFDLSGPLPDMVSEVFFQGEGQDKTTVRYGFGNQDAHQFVFNGTLRHCGFVDMELVCVNENGQQVKHLIQEAAGSKMTECFFARVKWTLSGEGLQLLQAQDRLLVIGSGIAHSRNRTATRDVRDGPYFFVNSTNLRVIGNIFRYNQGQTHCLQSRGFWEEGNTFIRDFRDQPTVVENGKTAGIDTRANSVNLGIYHTSVRNLYYSIEDESGVMISKNDGECKISEGAGGSGYQDTGYGQVVRSKGLLLTVAQATYANLSAYAWVSIISGAGAGQARRITTHTANTLTVDKAWTTPLDSTSYYAVTTMSMQRSLLKDNVARNGIGAYFNGYRATLSDVYVVGNDITDHGGIVFQTAQRSVPTADFSTQFGIVLDGNALTNTRNISTPEIAIQSVQVGADLTYRGTSLFGVEVRNNRIIGRTDYVRPEPPFYNEMSRQGIAVANIMQQVRDGQFNTVGAAKPILGPLLHNNYVENCAAAVYTNEGAYNLLISNTQTRNCGALVSRERIGPYQHDDIGTVEVGTVLLPPLPPAQDVFALSATRSYPAADSYTYETAVIQGSSYAAVCVVRAETGYVDDPTLPAIIIEGRSLRNDTGNCVHVYMPNGREVIIRYNNLASKGNADFINVTNDSRVTVYGNTATADGTQPIGTARGRFFYAYKPRKVNFYNNYGLNTAGSKVEKWSDKALAAGDTLKCYNNRADNICGGLESDYRQFLQVQEVQHIPGQEIYNNQIDNAPSLSRVEDNLNFGESSGTADSPLRWHHNFIRGATPSNAAAKTDRAPNNYTGTGSTTDGGGNRVPADQQPSYILGEYNWIVGTMNAAMNIAAGHHITLRKNKVVISGVLADGTREPAIGNAVGLFNNSGYSNAQFNNNQIVDNEIRYNSANGGAPFYNNGDIGPGSVPISAANNTLIDGATFQDELDAFKDWQKYLSTNKIEVGVTTTAS